MKFGASMFFTDYSMTPAALGRRWRNGASNCVGAGALAYPASRKTPFGGGDLPKRYYDTMDPFVTLTAAAAATKTLKVGTGVCLIAQRDPIQTAKLVASIDQVPADVSCSASATAGTRTRWRTTAPCSPRAQAGARADRGDEGDLDQDEAGISRRVRDFDPMMTWPKPVQKPHPPVIVGGAFRTGARRAVRYGDGWMPQVTATDHAADGTDSPVSGDGGGGRA